jgi:hypothetical protein
VAERIEGGSLEGLRATGSRGQRATRRRLPPRRPTACRRAGPPPPAATARRLLPAAWQVRQGEPLLLRYGTHSNADLLLSYGFVVPDNPFEAYSFPFDADFVLVRGCGAGG